MQLKTKLNETKNTGCFIRIGGTYWNRSAYYANKTHNITLWHIIVIESIYHVPVINVLGVSNIKVIGMFIEKFEGKKTPKRYQNLIWKV